MTGSACIVLCAYIGRTLLTCGDMHTHVYMQVSLGISQICASQCNNVLEEIQGSEEGFIDLSTEFSCPERKSVI